MDNKLFALSKGQRLSTLLLLATATVSLAFSPSTHQYFVAAQQSGSTSTSAINRASSTAPSPSSSSSTALCSSNQVDSMGKSIPQWFQHDISITAPSRGCHLITSD
eukprot:119038_1